MSTEPELSPAQQRTLVALYRIDALFGGIYLHPWLSGGRAKRSLRVLIRLGYLGASPNSAEDWDDRPIALTHAGRLRGWTLSASTPFRRRA